jgi:hypothetical protein
LRQVVADALECLGITGRLSINSGAARAPHELFKRSWLTEDGIAS